MGLEVLAGAALVGGIGGAIKGAKGTKAQVQNNTSTTTTNIAGPGANELAMQQEALKNYFAQSQLANQYQSSLDSADPYQAAARQSAMGILDGSAYQATPQEVAQIAAIRNASVQQGMQDINAGLDQRFQQINQSAGMRGLRGQALAQQQGDSIRAGTQAATSLQNQANLVAAQQMQQAPLSRIQSQQFAMGQGLSFADQLRQQAQSNLQQAANPALMQMMQNERLAAATRTTSGQQVTPGQKGSFTDALLGGLGGAAGMAGSAMNLMGSYNNLFGAGAGGGTQQLAGQSYGLGGYGNSGWMGA